MKSTLYKHQQEAHQAELLKQGASCFDHGKGLGLNACLNEKTKQWEMHPCSRVLVDDDEPKNLWHGIREEALQYMKENDISWWHIHGCSPNAITGHIMSSQVACLNHLFALGGDKEAVLAVLNGLIPDTFVDVKKLPLDVRPRYVTFEVTSQKNVLGEVDKNAKRGEYCTSVDAFIWAVDKEDREWILPIEWKYTEAYETFDQSADKKWGSGEKRLRIYTPRINNSLHLKSLKEYRGSIYYQEPCYQLMRQMLNTEYMIRAGEYGFAMSAKILHLHIIPEGNIDLRDESKDWKQYLQHPEEYQVVSPNQLLDPLRSLTRYKELLEYLDQRYWK